MRQPTLLVLLACAAPSLAEEAKHAGVCEIKKDPAAWDRSLVQVTAFVSHGFEDFTLFDPTCDSPNSIWVEYGGTASSGSVYCCGVSTNRTRPEPIRVDGIAVPLAVDEHFRRFDRMVQRKPEYSLVHATLVGRFLAGDRQAVPNGEVFFGGYGHLGCCSLLILEKVLAVDEPADIGLDYSNSAGQKWNTRPGCAITRSNDERTSSFIDVQHQAERNAAWRFDNPERVAREAFTRLTGEHQVPVTIKRTGKSQGRIMYMRKKQGAAHSSGHQPPVLALVLCSRQTEGCLGGPGRHRVFVQVPSGDLLS